MSRTGLCITLATNITLTSNRTRGLAVS